MKVRRPCLAVSTPGSAPHPETGESEAQRLICRKLQEGSQSLGCGLPRLAALGGDRQSGCSQLCIRAEPASCVESRPCAAGSRRTPGGPASTHDACFQNSDGPSPRWSQGLVRGTAGDEAGTAHGGQSVFSLRSGPSSRMSASGDPNEPAARLRQSQPAVDQVQVTSQASFVSCPS